MESTAPVPFLSASHIGNWQTGTSSPEGLPIPSPGPLPMHLALLEPNFLLYVFFFSWSFDLRESNTKMNFHLAWSERRESLLSWKQISPLVEKIDSTVGFPGPGSWLLGLLLSSCSTLIVVHFHHSASASYSAVRAIAAAGLTSWKTVWA